MKNLKLKNQLEADLRKLPDVEVDLWKDSDLLCVFYRGREFAHFHDHEEIDIRLSQQFIKKEGLTPLENSPYHPNRSQKSRWMQMRFTTEQERVDLLSLIERLIEDVYQNTDWGTKS